MAGIVYRIGYNDNLIVSKVIQVDQLNGDDSTAAVGGMPAKTLQRALSIASTISETVEIQIVSDYIVNSNETVTKKSKNTCIITCKNGAMITGLQKEQPIQTVSVDTIPRILLADGSYRRISGSCHWMDALNYYPFKISRVIRTQIDNGTYTQDVEFPAPEGITLTTDSLLDIHTGWVNAKGAVTSVSGNIVQATIESENYKITTNSGGFYRIENYGNDSNGFNVVKSVSGYTIQGNFENIRVPKDGLLTFYKCFNIIFKNCEFSCLGNGSKGLVLNECYAMSLRNCQFNHCSTTTFSSCVDVSVFDCFFFDTSLKTTRGVEIYIARNLFKHCMITFGGDSGVIEYNTICYYFKGIESGVSRASLKLKIGRMVVQYNELHHIGMLLQGDYGVIYRYGQSDCIFQYNYIHDCAGRNSDGSITGIYMDEGAYGCLCRYNLILNVTSSSYTHFSCGCVFYNNLFAYPLQEQIRYSQPTYAGGSSYIANIFFKGNLDPENIKKILDDGAAFQLNMYDANIELPSGIMCHSNVKDTPPFRNAMAADFYVGSYVNGKVSMGSTDRRNKTQSTIDTSFIDGVIAFGIPDTSALKEQASINERFIIDGNEYSYDVWFKKAEMKVYNVTNEYLEYE